MGILGRFQGRKDREQRVPRRPTIAKRIRMAVVPKYSEDQQRLVPALRASTNYSASREIVSASAKRSLEQSAWVAAQRRFQFAATEEKVQIDSLTEANIEAVVLDLLESTTSNSCSTLVMANALLQNDKCRESHAKGAEDGIFGIVAVLKGEAPPMKSYDRKLNKDKEEMGRRYEWNGVMDRLIKLPSSRDELISSWEDAKQSLEKVLIFPSKEEEEALTQMSKEDPIHEKYSKMMETALEEVNERRHDLNARERFVFRAIVSQSDQLRRDILEEKKDDDGGGDDDDEYMSVVRRIETDLSFNATLRTKQEIFEKLRQNEDLKQLEERMKLKEAKERAASLMRPLTVEEKKIVEDAVYGSGPGGEVIAQCGSDTVLRQSMRTLQPGQWLNDEVIHYFLVMLANRDEELCKLDSNRKRSHFFKSFFLTKLLNIGNATRDGVYEYSNVKRWSKKVPGKDIFALDKIVFPVNMDNMHWICAVAFMQEKRIQIYDSMGSSGKTYLEAIFNYLKDEHMDKKKKPLPDQDQWELISTTRDTPQQRNGTYECVVGVNCSHLLPKFRLNHVFVFVTTTQALIAVSSHACLRIFCPKAPPWSSLNNTSTSAGNASQCPL
jgi:Ulp1 protease family, C-terminal catalytic domain